MINQVVYQSLLVALQKLPKILSIQKDVVDSHVKYKPIPLDISSKKCKVVDIIKNTKRKTKIPSY